MTGLALPASSRARAHLRVGAAAVVAFLALLLVTHGHAVATTPATPSVAPSPSVVPAQPSPSPVVPGTAQPPALGRHGRDGDRDGFGDGGGRPDGDRFGDGGGGPGGDLAPAPAPGAAGSSTGAQQ